MILHGARLVTPDGVIPAGSVHIDGALIAAVNSHNPRFDHRSGPGIVDLHGGWLIPGFVDLHCHGGGGADFASADPVQLQTAAGFHARHGTTTLLASVVSDTVGRLCTQLAAIADHIEAGDTPVVGAHLEGPFLSFSRCGAQNPEYLRDPDRDLFLRMNDASRGTLAMITLAPELPGAHGVIEAARTAGVIVAIGHTNATYDQARDAFHQGARVATHLFNGMAPLHHRDPGPVLAALEAGAVCEIIADGHHVHPAAIRLTATHAQGRLALITDAISAAGAGDGDYQLGNQRVVVSEGQARLADGDSLAGSTLTMDAALRYATGAAGLDLSVAVAAGSTNPASVLTLGETRGKLEPGGRADLVHLDENLQVQRVMRAGRWSYLDVLS